MGCLFVNQVVSTGVVAEEENTRGTMNRQMMELFKRPYLRSYLHRLLTSQPNVGEVRLKERLNSEFPLATSIQVEDISGGCGSMYQIHVESVEFKGLNTVKQHQLVTQALKEEIKGMHGIRISTSVPSAS